MTVAQLEAVLDGSYEPAPWPEPESMPPPRRTAKQQARADQQVQARAVRQQARAERASQRQAAREAKEKRRLTPTEQTLAAEARLETERMRESRKAVHFTMGNVYFEQFVERRMQPELQDGAAVPANWVGTTVDWNSLRQQAEDVARERLAAEFAEGIALRGLTPVEMASGTDVMIGKVVQR